MLKDHQIRVAVADEHPVYRKGLVALLSEVEDIRLTAEAHTAPQLIDALRAQHAGVVLMDLALAEVDGADLVRDIRRTFQDQVRTIIVSNEATEHNLIRMIRSGVSAFLRKDSATAEIVQAIRMVNACGYYFNDLLTSDHLRRQVSDTHQRPLFTNGIHLSDREREVLVFICQQYTNNEIAEALGLSASTVHGYRNSLLIKTGAKNTAGLVMYAVGAGMI